MKRKSAKFQRTYRSLVTLIVVLAAVFSITYIVLLEGNVVIRFALAIIVLMVSGRMIATANGIKNSYGAYLLGGKKGIKFIESLSKKHRGFWLGLCDWGLAFSFGLLSYFMFKKYLSKKMVLFGMISIVLILIFVYPYLSLILSFLNIPQVTSRISSSAGGQGIGVLYYAFLAASIIGGFSLSTIFLILYSGGSIIYGILLFLVGLLESHPNYTILNSQIPGVAPIIPGITIPLFAGIISLFILLVVHELSHSVLAKMRNVRIKSIGVILFGIIPLGAFVEPDEKKIKRLKSKSQNRIAIAGISANMLTSLLFFAITFLMLSFVLPNISTGGVLVKEVIQNASAYNVIAPNSTILGWGNRTIRNSFDLAQAEANYKPGSYVNITTDKGRYLLLPDKEGRIGIIVAPAEITTTYQATNFVYAIAALSFGLNFFVAIFNLLPIPAFDGWRIYQNKIKNKRLLKAMSFVVIAAILVNVLPWFWILY